MQRICNFIAGEACDPASGAWLDKFDPATGAVAAQIADSGDADVDRAVAAAREASPGWSATPTEQRSRLLMRLAELIERDLESLAQAEARDTGKPIRLAREMDIPRAAANFRFFAGAALHWRSDFHLTDLAPSQGVAALNYTLRPPLGVVALISPWNLPLYLLSWKIAPAIATGNTCVCKPSELTPTTASMLGALCNEAGIPPGVVNIVHGAGARAGAALVAHERIAGISFTGGTATGRAIAASAAPAFKKLSLELGGKNPTLIFEDVDLSEVVPQAVRAAFTNQGQVCLCGSRVFVARSIFDEFTRRFVDAAKALRIGDPADEATQQGALVSAAHREKVRGYIRLAREEGGAILTGGEETPSGLPARCCEGYFLAPTVITGLSHTCRTQQEEIFGPVVALTPFDSEREAIEMANSTPYGLAASLWTRDLSRAHRVARQIEAGIIWVNCWLLRDLRTPFGGLKQSGVGREGGEEALRFFTEPRNVCIRVTEEPSR